MTTVRTARTAIRMTQTMARLAGGGSFMLANRPAEVKHGSDEASGERERTEDSNPPVAYASRSPHKHSLTHWLGPIPLELGDVFGELPGVGELVEHVAQRLAALGRFHDVCGGEL